MVYRFLIYPNSLTGRAVSRPQHLQLPQYLGGQRVPHDQEPPYPVGEADRVVVHLESVLRLLSIIDQFIVLRSKI